MLYLRRTVAPVAIAFVAVWSLNAGWARGGPTPDTNKEKPTTREEARSSNTTVGGGEAASAAEGSTVAVSESAAYPLATCIMDGRAFGADAVVKHYNGREVRFCGARCAKEFEKNKEASMKKIDEAIIASQKPFYPMDTCVVSGMKLNAKGKPYDLVYKNRLVRFCCRPCVRQFELYPRTPLAALNQAVVERQLRGYPLDMCVVSGEKLDTKGTPINYVYAGQLVRLSGSEYKKEFDKDPGKYMAMIAEARKRSDPPKTGKGEKEAAPSDGSQPGTLSQEAPKSSTAKEPGDVTR